MSTRRPHTGSHQHDKTTIRSNCHVPRVPNASCVGMAEPKSAGLAFLMWIYTCTCPLEAESERASMFGATVWAWPSSRSCRRRTWWRLQRSRPRSQPIWKCTIANGEAATVETVFVGHWDLHATRHPFYRQRSARGSAKCSPRSLSVQKRKRSWSSKRNVGSLVQEALPSKHNLTRKRTKIFVTCISLELHCVFEMKENTTTFLAPKVVQLGQSNFCTLTVAALAEPGCWSDQCRLQLVHVWCRYIYVACMANIYNS